MTPLFGRQRVLCFPSISPLFREADPAMPISFMDKVFNFFIVKGSIEPAGLFEAPFTDIRTILSA